MPFPAFLRSKIWRLSGDGFLVVGVRTSYTLKEKIYKDQDTLPRLLIPLCFTPSLLAACGGGGSDGGGSGGGGGGGGDNGTDGDTANQLPSFTSGNSATTAESSTATATDADTDSLNFTGSGDDGALFEIDSGTGVLSFISAPDFEKPTDANEDNDYEVEIEVSDGKGNADREAVTVSVADRTQLVAKVSYPTPNANLGELSTRPVLPAF